MTFQPGYKPVNRKLPCDEIVEADLVAGLTRQAIADKYGVSKSAVAKLLMSRGWDRRKKAPDLKARPVLRETQKTIVVERMVEYPGGVRPVRISLPRIPTLHGEYGVAS